MKQNSALHDLHSLGATSFVNCPTAEDGRPPVSPQGPDVVMVGLHQPKMGGGGQSLRLFSLVWHRFIFILILISCFCSFLVVDFSASRNFRHFYQGTRSSRISVRVSGICFGRGFPKFICTIHLLAQTDNLLLMMSPLLKY